MTSQNLGARVALVDLDLAGGDLAALLDIEPTRSMVHVVEEFERLDSLLMDSLMVDAAPGLRPVGLAGRRGGR